MLIYCAPAECSFQVRSLPVLRREASSDLPVRASNEGLLRLRVLQLFPLLLKGVAEAALQCAHRATTVLSWGLCEQEGHLATPVPPLLTALSTGPYNPRQGLSLNVLIQLRKWQNLRTSTSQAGRGWSTSAPNTRPSGSRRLRLPSFFFQKPLKRFSRARSPRGMSWPWPKSPA